MVLYPSLLCLITSHNGLPSPSVFLPFVGDLDDLTGFTQFSWISPMYIGGMHVIKILVFSC